MVKTLFVLGVLVFGGVPLAAQAQTSHVSHLQMAQDAGQFPITPSQAAEIAKQSEPGARVLSVKLLPSGTYAVTLKAGANVTRVMVDATSGSVS